MKALLYSLLAGVVLLLGACEFLAGKLESKPVGPLGELVDREWQLVEAKVLDNDSTVSISDRHPFDLVFQEGGQLEVVDACNRGQGHYQVTSDSLQLTIGSSTCTEKGCDLPYGSMQFCQFILVEAASFSVSEDQLVIEGEARVQYLDGPRRHRMVFKER